MPNIFLLISRASESERFWRTMYKVGGEGKDVTNLVYLSELVKTCAKLVTRNNNLE